METSKPLLTLGFIAADTTALDNRFVKLDTNGKLVLCGANEKAVGVLDENSQPDAAGDEVAVITHGVAVIMSAGSFASGDPIVSDSSGKAVGATAVSVTVNSGSGGGNTTSVVAGSKLPQAINGYAIDKSTGSGKLVRIRLA